MVTPQRSKNGLESFSRRLQPYLAMVSFSLLLNPTAMCIHKRFLKITFVISTALLIALAGCEGDTSGSGYALDKTTHKPLAGVVAKSYAKRGSHLHYHQEMVTDSTGYFTGTTGTVGCGTGGDCPDLMIELIKSGYTTVQIVNPDKDSVYME
jgi:hypothetical protein